MSSLQSKRSSALRRPQLSTRVVAALLCALGIAPAQAQITCFPPPTSVPGLSGPPTWQPPGTVRTDLNEPRWAASPLSPFANDLTGTEGAYRILRNATGDKLYVSLQTSYDNNTVSAADRVFFGISKTVTASRGVVINLAADSPAGTFIEAPDTSFVAYTYNSAESNFTPQPSVRPAWVQNAVVFSNAPDGDVDFGVNFIVDLANPELGIGPADSFKLVIGMLVRRTEGETAIFSPGATLPPTAVQPFQNLHANPADWLQASPTGGGCINGITLSSSQIRTTNGNPTEIETAAGHVNVFEAQPTIAPVPLAPNMLKAEFRLANWGSIADPNAAWAPIPGAAAVLNDAAGLIRFTCPANTATATCGMPVPAQKHQCLQVRLNHGAGFDQTTTPIAQAAAYRNMNFVPLSVDKRRAEISLRGLPPTPNGRRDVYLYVYPKNLPAHGKQQLTLPKEAMEKTREMFFRPPPAAEQVKSAREAAAWIKQAQKAQQAAALKAARAEPVIGRDGRSVIGGSGKPVAGKPVGNDDKANELPSLITAEQVLRKVWPSYDVRPYYDLGHAPPSDGVPTLVPMYPFTLFFSHDGDLYGYTHDIRVESGGEMVELVKPTETTVGVYKLTMVSDGVAAVTTTVEAHEIPIKPKQTEEESVVPETEGNVPPPVERRHCSCAVPGYETRLGSGPRSAGEMAGVLGLLALGFVRLRRRRLA